MEPTSLEAYENIKASGALGTMQCEGFTRSNSSIRDSRPQGLRFTLHDR
jgi:hypothetical protein